MPLGILEPKGAEHVPGTTRYYDDPSRPQYATDDTIGLKVDKSGKDPIILNPQPSDDPNDPLNWPLWRRDLITFVLCFAAILATALGPILAANTLTIAGLFGETLTRVALLTGYFLLGAGAAAIFFVPSGRIWGKRHLFLIGIVFIIFSSAWAGGAGTNYGSLAAARAIQGIGAAPFESLLNAAVGDLYFVHQRGTRMAFTNLAVFGGAFFTPIVTGIITRRLGWPWTFYFVACFSALVFPLVFFFCPETAYRREDRLNTDTVGATREAKVTQEVPKASAANSAQPVSPTQQAVPRRGGFVFFPTSNALQPIGDASTPPKSFIESISLFDGRKTDERYWVLLLRPFPILANPAFIWGCLIQGTMIGWTVFIGVIVAALFIGPPYLWSEVEAGYAYTGAFVGALAGFVISGLLADTSVKWLTKRNGGVYEPEFRILLVIPMLIVGGIGLFGFALTAGEVISRKYTYMPPLVFFGFEVAGMVIGAVASSLYIVDAYRDLTIEGFTVMIIFKNILSFGLTASAYDWFVAGGVKQTMLPIAIVQVVICLTSVPMYVFGKRVRAFYHKHDLLALTGLR
ncbi:major facilitator superfamily domain-containing protein [Emericellopsis atlantica]|uniref:Major facilitator superfamily domain-containing protein n=1 Tax=Emericellopsis atlantica TaxID=2614577 RepID=A0A9P8CT11_9HYPO|nr:major facilitator superfamily domain-containing protein [Emericellopsis atlantica]KAG9257922.1 major facilitator superfamily domain-containing protein [Emericellopsis atlantica]